jgi:hypothetical protein
MRFAQIGDNQIIRIDFHQLHGFNLGGGLVDLVPFLPEKIGKGRALIFITIDNKDRFQMIRCPLRINVNASGVRKASWFFGQPDAG